MTKTLVCLAFLVTAAIVGAPTAAAWVPVNWEYFYMHNGLLNGQTPGFLDTDPTLPTWCEGRDPYDPALTRAGSEVSVLNHTVRVSSNTSRKTTSRWTRKAVWCPDPPYVVMQFWAKKGSFTGTDVTSWYLSAGLPNTVLPDGTLVWERAFGIFTGNSSSVTCWGPTFGELVKTVALTDQWQCFTAVGSGGDPVTMYYQGNTYLGYALCWAHNNPKIYWWTLQSYASTSGSSYVDLGNFSYGYSDTLPPAQPIVMTPPPSPPESVVNFKALGFDGQVLLSWMNPALPDFAGTMIRYKTTGYPTSPTDGALVCNKTNSPDSDDSYLHTGLSNDVTYYYSAFAYDTGLNYAPRNTASATPRTDVCWTEPFDYPNSLLADNDGWLGDFNPAVTVENQAVKIVGDGAVGRCTRNVTCHGWNGVIWVRVQVRAGVGANNMWDFWINDASGNNLARWYGSGTTAKPRIGSTSSVLADVYLTGGWDNLDVKINTNTNVDEFFFNGVSLGTLSHTSTGAGDSVGSVLLGRQAGTYLPGQYVWVDNISIGGDLFPPSPVTDFEAVSGDTQISLSWRNPTDPDFAGTKILYKTTGYPSSPTDGTVAYSGLATSYIHTGLTNGTRYYYAAYAFDLDTPPNYSTGARATGLPGSTAPPGPVTNFAATGGNGMVGLAWTNPSNLGFTATMIRFKTTGYPTGPTDGSLLVDKPNVPRSTDNYLHTGLTNGVTYYYSAFAHDLASNYAAKVNASTTPYPGVCWTEPFAYPNGLLGGNSGWTGDCTMVQVVSQTVQVNTAAVGCGITRPVICYGLDGVIWARIQAKSGIGTGPAWDVWVNDAAGSNFARWYGSPTTARPRIGGTNDVLNPVTLTGGWDTLDIKVDTNTRLSEFFFNGVSLGTLNYGSQGAIPPVGQVMIGCRDGGTTGNYMWLDNFMLGGDLQAPGPVTNFRATAGDGQVNLSWTNPSSDYFGTAIVCKTTGCPTGPTDGTTIYTGTGTSCLHSGLTNGTRYYYAAYAFDIGANYSTGVTASAYAAADATIRQAKGLANGQVRALRANVVSARDSGYFYLQDPLDLQGIKVISSQAVLDGYKLDVIGVIGGQGSERYVDCSTGSVQLVAAGPFALGVIGLGNASAGGTAMNGYTPGVVGGTGPNNIGLLVKVWGRTTQKEKSGQWFYIDDGSGLKDGTQTEVSNGVFRDSVGIRVKANGSGYTTGQYLVVTGVVSTFDSGGLRPQIVPQSGGIQPAGP